MSGLLGDKEIAELVPSEFLQHDPVKTAIFGGNNARLYGVQPKRAQLELSRDRFATLKSEYEKRGPARSNLRYGYVAGPIDYTFFA